MGVENSHVQFRVRKDFWKIRLFALKLQNKNKANNNNNSSSSSNNNNRSSKTLRYTQTDPKDQ